MDTEYIERCYHKAVDLARAAAVESRAAWQAVEEARDKTREASEREDTAIRTAGEAWAKLKQARAAGGEDQREG